jgi:hypothetical protein
MSEVLVDNITSRSGGAVGAPSGIVVTGVITATSFVGDGSGLSGIDATALKDSGGNVKVQGNTSGIVVTGVSTFTDNVSVGGVVTYEDVTNIDSVGIITARDGIKVSAGQSISAVSGIVTYYGDGSKLSGVESGVVNFVASGDIGNGQTVIIKTDGTVGIVTQTTSNTPSAGTPVLMESTSTEYISSTYDTTNNKVVIVYAGASGAGTAIVGAVSGTTITFGTPVIFDASYCPHTSTAYDSANNRVVIAYSDTGTSYHGYAIVGTVSGTSISFGTPVVFFNGGEVRYTSTVYDSTNEKVIISYQDYDNSYHGRVRVGTVSGTSISFGSEVVFHSAGTYYITSAYDSTNQKVIITYMDAGNSQYGTAVVGTVSGTSISFGSDVVFNSGTTYFPTPVYDSTNGKVVIVYRDASNSNYGTAIVGTVSGTSISFGSEVVFLSGTTGNLSATFAGSGKIVIAYTNESISFHGYGIVGTVSGTSISFGTPVVFESDRTFKESTVFDPDTGKVIIAYQDDNDNDYGKAVNFSVTSQTTNLTTENYIGIAAEAIANGATGKINVVTGTNTGQTGLTTAQKYFVQPTGTLATSAGSPSVVAGTAISDTKIVVR